MKSAKFSGLFLTKLKKLYDFEFK